MNRCYFKILIFITILCLSSFYCKSSQNDHKKDAENRPAKISLSHDMRIDSMYVSLIDLDYKLEFSNTKIYPDSSIRVLWAFPRDGDWNDTYVVNELSDSVAKRIVKLVEGMMIEKTIPLRVKDIPSDLCYSNSNMYLLTVTLFENGNKQVDSEDISWTVPRREIENSKELFELFHYLTEGRHYQFRRE